MDGGFIRQEYGVIAPVRQGSRPALPVGERAARLAVATASGFKTSCSRPGYAS